MSRVATAELGLAPAAVADNNGGDFDVFSSLRDGVGGEDFSSGIDEGRSADTDEAASGLDLVAVAGGKEKLDTLMDDNTDLKDMPAPVDALSLAGKSEINSSENRMSDERRAAICQGVASAACASCAARDDCPILRMRNFANENLQPAPERESYLRDLLSDDDDGIVVAGYANPDSGADLTNADITEISDDKTDKLIEQVAPPNQGNEIPTSETTESPDEPADIKEAEQSFLEPAIVTDDVDEIREAQPENVSEASVNTSGKEYFTQPTEESRPSIEIKQQTFDVISGAADKKNQQPAFESPDILMQTKTRTVPSSPGVSEDTQIANENNTLPKNETANFLSGESKLVDSVVKNTYDGDDAAAVSDIKPSSIEHPKENNVVAAAPKLSDSEPRQTAASSFTSASEQRSAAQFDATEMNKPAAESIDGSNVKPLQNTQPREAELGTVAGCDGSIQALDGADNVQPGNLTPDVDDVLLPQERTVAASVPAEYDKNETYQSSGSYSIGQSGGAPQAILSQEQMLVESSEDSLTINDYANFDSNLVQPKTDDTETDVFVANDVVNTTDKTDVAVSIEMIDITPNLPDKHTAVDRNGTQLAVDLPQELGDELAVDTDASEPQIPVFRQLDCYDTTADIGRSEDRIWAEEEVFFVKQDLPGVESELTLTEVAAVISPAEVVTVCEEPGDLKLSVDDEIGVGMESAGQLDNFKTSSVPEITNDYEPVEQIAIPTSPATELILDVELDEPAVEILEERIMPREERDNIVMEASEKSDLPRLDDEVETIITDTSDVEPAIDLSEAQEELAATEVSEAVESELDEQNDLAVDSAVDSYGYNSETSAVSDNVLVVKSRPSPGLWPDDSRLNPEEESASTAQSSADDTSLVSRLVGMFVVAICVVRGRQSVKV
jgi:hypothetical protein cdiviTM7_00850